MRIRRQACGTNWTASEPTALSEVDSKALLKAYGLKGPKELVAKSANEAAKLARKIGFPVVIRPSYVLGGRAMEIVQDKEHLEQFFAELPERERQILALYYEEEMTMAEIGEVIGVCESRVSQLRSLALSRLRASLRESQMTCRPGS